MGFYNGGLGFGPRPNTNINVSSSNTCVGAEIETTTLVTVLKMLRALNYSKVDLLSTYLGTV